VLDRFFVVYKKYSRALSFHQSDLSRIQ
jgi:hypothetical protein